MLGNFFLVNLIMLVKSMYPDAIPCQCMINFRCPPLLPSHPPQPSAKQHLGPKYLHCILAEGPAMLTPPPLLTLVCQYIICTICTLYICTHQNGPFPFPHILLLSHHICFILYRVIIYFSHIFLYTLQILLDLCVSEKELAKTRSQN